MTPLADGSAAVIVTGSERAKDLVPMPLRVAGSTLATDTIALRRLPCLRSPGARTVHVHRFR